MLKFCDSLSKCISLSVESEDTLIIRKRRPLSWPRIVQHLLPGAADDEVSWGRSTSSPLTHQSTHSESLIRVFELFSSKLSYVLYPYVVSFLYNTVANPFQDRHVRERGLHDWTPQGLMQYRQPQQQPHKGLETEYGTRMPGQPTCASPQGLAISGDEQYGFFHQQPAGTPPA